MGQIRLIHFFTVLVCFFITAVFIYQKGTKETVVINKSIQTVVENIAGWQDSGKIDLDKEIVYSLDLDDYIFNSFLKESNRVSLYVGYYYSSKKLSAAHSPLVCYPGQGWNILSTSKLKEKIGKHELNLMAMEIANRGRKELILYWFQINDKTTLGTFEQKINSLLNKINQKSEENAFVRISIPMAGLTKKEAHRIGVDFIKSFYPVFLQFITESD